MITIWNITGTIPLSTICPHLAKRKSRFFLVQKRKREREKIGHFLRRVAPYVCLLQCGTHGNIHIIKANFKKAHCILALLITFWALQVIKIRLLFLLIKVSYTVLLYNIYCTILPKVANSGKHCTWNSETTEIISKIVKLFNYW